MRQADVPGPDIYWMETRDTWETLYVLVPIYDSEVFERFPGGVIA